MTGSKPEIMEATYSALCKHGYANLTIQKIADEFDGGKSLIYYHFDDRQDLMISFLDYMTGHVRESHEKLEDCSPGKKLDRMLDMTLGIESDEEWRFRKAFLEIRTQAQYNEEFAEKFREIDGMILEDVEKILREIGVKKPGKTAEIVVSMIDGAVSRKVAMDDREGLEELKQEIKSLVQDHLSCLGN